MEQTYCPRILVPLDGSKTARTAVDEILPLATLTNSPITMLAVLEPIMEHHFEAFATAEEISVAEAVEIYVESEARQVSQDTGLAAEGCVVAGFGERPGDVIARYAADNDFDLLAMTTHGLGGFKRLMLGSVAHQVVNSAEVPVLLLRAP